jgi:leucyl aminopeptidase
MPLFEEYREQLRSEMADLANIGGRPAGACTAASFLHAFSGDRAWAHLDVAGTAWLEDARPDQAKGATGVMVRTLAELASSSSAWAVTR